MLTPAEDRCLGRHMRLPDSEAACWRCRWWARMPTRLLARSWWVSHWRYRESWFWCYLGHVTYQPGRVIEWLFERTHEGWLIWQCAPQTRWWRLFSRTRQVYNWTQRRQELAERHGRRRLHNSEG